jgi:acyl-[acyl-carrier-protein] desaturase
VIRRAGIYGPRDYLKIVEEQIRYWDLGSLTDLNEEGERARDKIMEIPARLKRIADAMESRRRSKTFSFEVAFAREFEME